MGEMKNMLSLSRNSFRTSSDGSVIAIVAAFLFLAFIMVAIGIELTYGSAAQEQARHSAKLAALGALDAYLKTTGSETTRHVAAEARANEVASANVILGGLTSPVRNLSISGSVSSGTPQLIPGIWHYLQPSGSAPLPDPCNGNYPCFEEERINPANAFQIKGQLYESIPARFARTFGITTIADPVVDAVATMIPRHGCFVVDLSASMTRETHLLNDPNPLDPLRQATDSVYLNTSDGYYNGMPNNRAGSGLTTGDPAYQTIHFKDDYQQRSIYTDADYNNVNSQHHPNPATDSAYSTNGRLNSSYLIDTYRDAIYLGPEPLRTVFHGIHNAIKKFEERAVAGDKACIIFYDTELLWPRIVQLTDDWEFLKRITDFDNELDLIIQHGLFPLPGANTDTRKALLHAVNQFHTEQQRNPTLPVSNFVVLIGDGLTNSSSCFSPSELNSKYDFTGDGVFDGMDHLAFQDCLVGANTQSCASLNSDYDLNQDGKVDIEDDLFLKDHVAPWGNCTVSGAFDDYDHFKIAAKQLVRFVTAVYEPLDIPIHVVQVGSHVAPHTVDIANPDSTCMTDHEAREQNITIVNGGNANGQPITDINGWRTAYASMSSTQPFYQAGSEFYKVAKATRGIWAPLRPAGNGPCPNLCDPNQIRKTTDPLCRTEQEQMDAFMEQIIGENPLQVVRERAR